MIVLWLSLSSLRYSFIKLLSKNEQWDLLSWKVNSILLFSFLGVLSRSFLVSWSFNRYIILLPGITDPDRVRVFHESLCTSFELVLIVFIQCQLLFLLPVIDFVIVGLTDNWFESVFKRRGGDRRNVSSCSIFCSNLDESVDSFEKNAAKYFSAKIWFGNMLMGLRIVQIKRAFAGVKDLF